METGNLDGKNKAVSYQISDQNTLRDNLNFWGLKDPPRWDLRYCEKKWNTAWIKHKKMISEGIYRNMKIQIFLVELVKVHLYKDLVFQMVKTYFWG